MRTEKDALGSIELPDNTPWGIHTQRALGNFSVSTRKIPYSLISALALVKHAAALTNAELGYLAPSIAEAIGTACIKICETDCSQSFPLDALQGGAGTSINMNANEVIANMALKSMGRNDGLYDTINPIAHVNLHQSTNDVFPTALRIAAITGLRELSQALSDLQGAFQSKESDFHDIIKMGRTQLQPAVPMTLGQEFSAFSEAISRDRWRTFKCEERLRMVNIGGTAIGTGLTAPREYIFRVIEVLRSLTGMGLTRNENPIDGTANADVYVEVSGILKAVAATFSKIASDLRLLHFLGEISLPPMQAGSSIMPGKVNPVIMECAMQTAQVVRANDFIIGECAAKGTLQINEYMPLIAFSLLESIDLLKNTALMMAPHIANTSANAAICRSFVDNTPSILTALLPYIGYDETLRLLNKFKAQQTQNSALALKTFLQGELDHKLIDQALSDKGLVSLGFTKKECAS